MNNINRMLATGLVTAGFVVASCILKSGWPCCFVIAWIIICLAIWDCDCSSKNMNEDDEKEEE